MGTNGNVVLAVLLSRVIAHGSQGAACDMLSSLQGLWSGFKEFEQSVRGFQILGQLLLLLNALY